MTKLEEGEINRIVNSAAFNLFRERKASTILDTDFYEYLGVTVRTTRANCLGRLATVEHALKALLEKRPGEVTTTLIDLHTFLLSKFKTEIESRK